MKYPNHLILDLESPSKQSYASNWKEDFRTKSSSKSSSSQSSFDFVSVVSPSTSVSRPMTSDETRSSLTFSIFDIHFLRKEKLYTKLKYSRCPQYDIVSGGFAAILAGFVGFLISEKFGIELVDSGDFYNAFMYGVFGAFSLRPLVRIYSSDHTPYSPVSLRYLLLFSRDITILLYKSLASLATKVIMTAKPVYKHISSVLGF